MGDTQWQKLDGNAELVRSKGTTYREIADAIGRATATLDAIVDDASTTAKAMDATRSLASDVREDIAKATERYRFTGDALVDYATALDPAITDSETAATQIATIEEELAAARTTADNAQSDVDGLPADAADGDVDSATSTLSTANSRVSTLETSLSFWQGRWNDAKADKDSAAETAKSHIDEVVTGEKVNDLKDGFWDHVGEAWDKIGKWVKVVCDVAGILAIFLSWVPVLGQILLVLAAIGSIIAIVEGIVKMANEGFSWGALFSIGMGVMGLFGGKALGALGKYAKARAITQTRALNGITEARRFATVSELVEASGTSVSTRVADVLKSPFVQSATDQKIWRMVQRGSTDEAFSIWRASKFPLPYKDGALRWAVGNDDVADMFKFFGQRGNIVTDGVTMAAQATATIGTVTYSMTNHAKNAVAIGQAIAGGDGWGMASSGNSIVSGPAGGSYGSLIGKGINITKAVAG